MEKPRSGKELLPPTGAAAGADGTGIVTIVVGAARAVDGAAIGAPVPVPGRPVAVALGSGSPDGATGAPVLSAGVLLLDWPLLFGQLKPCIGPLEPPPVGAATRESNAWLGVLKPGRLP